jgi:hypothetical protein
MRSALCESVTFSLIKYRLVIVKWQERDTFSGSWLRVNIEVGRAPTVAYILVYKLQVDIHLNYLPIYTHAAAYPILAVQSILLTSPVNLNSLQC